MYDYGTQKQDIFTEEGQILFLRIRDKVKRLLNTAGAARMFEIIQGGARMRKLKLIKIHREHETAYQDERCKLRRECLTVYPGGEQTSECKYHSVVHGEHFCKLKKANKC